MPQLDFAWWMIKFFLVWAAVFIVLALLLNTPSTSGTTQASSISIDKTSTTWQW